MCQNFLLVTIILFVGIQTGLTQGTKLNTTFMSKAPLIDGKINQNEWLIADSQTVFIQMEPQKGCNFA